MLEQIRRLRALVAQQKADYEAQLSVPRNTIAEMHNATEPLEVQAELDAFEAELTPAPTAEVAAYPAYAPPPETLEATTERV